MSTLQLDRPYATSEERALPAPRVRHLPSERPIARPSVRPVRATRRKANVTGRLVTLAFVALLSFGVSSLSGQVMLEKARHEKAAAVARTKEAQRAEVALREKLDDLTSADRIAEWASAHGFMPADVSPAPVPKGHSGAHYAYAR